MRSTPSWASARDAGEESADRCEVGADDAALAAAAAGRDDAAMSRHREERRAAKEARRDARKADRRAAKAVRRRATAESFLHLVAAGEAASPQARSLSSCPCTKDCTLHGECRLCVAYHAGRRDELPRCAR